MTMDDCDTDCDCDTDHDNDHPQPHPHRRGILGAIALAIVSLFGGLYLIVTGDTDEDEGEDADAGEDDEETDNETDAPLNETDADNETDPNPASDEDC